MGEWCGGAIGIRLDFYVIQIGLMIIAIVASTSSFKIIS